MKWINRQFGEFEYDPSHVLSFPAGMIGFEDLHRYILINDEDSKPFLWLVSLEDGEIAFPLIIPSLIAEEYEIAGVQETDTTTLTVVALRDNIEESTVNLRSPVLIDNKTQMGKQIVLENDRYPFQHPLFVVAETAEKG